MADDKKQDIFKPIAYSGDSVLGARCKNGEVTLVEGERVKHGEPLNPENDLLSLRPRKDGAFDVKVIYEGKGPAKVATPKYRKGWDDVFGKPPKREDMN